MISQKANYKSKNEDNLSSDNDEDEECDEQEIQALQKMSVKKNEGLGRTSVSAEVFGKFNQKKNFIPKVINKSPEQKQKISQIVNQSFMFSALDEKDRNIIIDAMVQNTYKSSEYIIRQGDDGDFLFILESGTADCYKTINGSEKLLKTYTQGESFGELSLLYNAPRAASIIAKTDCIAWGLDRQTFNYIVKDAAQKKRDKYNDFLSKVKIFESMDSYEKMQIADALKVIKCQKGEYVMRQGEEGDIFFMIEDGELEAYIFDLQTNQEKKVMSYQKEMYFGELALIKNQPRAASIVCKTDCTLVALDRYTFKRLLGPIDEILKRNADNYKQFNV